MREDVKRRAHRERLALTGEAMNGAAVSRGAQIMSPVITSRPEIDSMLGDMAFCSKILLEAMRNKLMDGQIPDREELRNFRETCETVLRQARTEIELEKFAHEKQNRMGPEESAELITAALSRAGIAQEVTDTVLDALKLSQTT